MYLKIRDRLGYISNTSSNFEMTGILLGQELRKRKIPQEKIAITQQTMEPDMIVSHAARLHGINPSVCCLSGKNNIGKDASLLLLPQSWLLL